MAIDIKDIADMLAAKDLTILQLQKRIRDLRESAAEKPVPLREAVKPAAKAT